MQEISLLPVYAGVIPNKATQNDYDFANNIFGFINYSGNTLIPFFNETITDLNILSGQINTKANEVATNTQTVSEKTALVQSITASLPAGTVLDSAVGATSTWSSSKIKTLLDNITAIITSSDTSLDSFQEIVAYIKQNKTVLDTLAISNIAGLTSALSGKLGVNDTAASANYSTTSGTATTVSTPSGTYKHLGNWGNDNITANGNILVNSAYRAELAHSITTATATNATAGASAGDIGTYAFLRRSVNVMIYPGNNVAGSDLTYADQDSGVGGSPNGTWKCMGCINNIGSTLFLRIA